MIKLEGVWKKYSTRKKFRRSIREDIIGFFNGRPRKNLEEDEFWALREINLEVKKGECVGIYGPNGSGKSTILKLIASVTFPTKGEVFVEGKVAPLISVGAGFHPDLTGRENIFMNGTIIGMSIREIREKINSIIEFSELEEKFINMPIRKYSSGMNVRLGFSIAVHSSAENLLIDEILAVGDESFKNKCIEKIKELHHGGKTMLIVSHDLDRLKKMTDGIIFLEKGKILKIEETKSYV